MHKETTLEENPMEETHMEETPMEETPLQKEHSFTMSADVGTCFSIELLFTGLIEKIKEDEPTMAGYYALFGATEGLLRSAKLMLQAAPNNPELANSIAKIAKVISLVGQNMIEEINQSKREESVLNSEEIDSIMDAISNIDVSIPDNLK